MAAKGHLHVNPKEAWMMVKGHVKKRDVDGSEGTCKEKRHGWQ
jgi:hypothetical protein